MLEITLGAAIAYYFTNQSAEIKDQKPGTVHYTEIADSRHSSYGVMHRESVQITPAVESQFRGIVRQMYDYSCGSAALTTLLNGYAGFNLSEKQILNGMLRYGETQKIVDQGRFSLLDMKRLVTALGMQSGGYKASTKQLIELDKPVIVPITYAGFNHFVVYKAFKDGRVYLADPALGNISFDLNRFEQVWDDNTLFMINLKEGQAAHDILALSEEDMRHVDDRTINKFALVDIQYPQFQQEKMADRAASVYQTIDRNPDSSTYNQTIQPYVRLHYKRK